MIWCAIMLAVLSPDGAVIEGRVLDQGSREPLRSVRVALVGTTFHTLTAVDGTFRFDVVPPGDYTLSASTVGYRLLSRAIQVSGSGRYELEFLLGQEAATVKETITVTAPIFEEIERAGPSQLTLNGSELENLAGVLIDDPFRSVQTLPGVATNDDFQSFYSVRGGEFRNNGIVVDGVLTHSLVHTVSGTQEQTGSIAALNGDIVEGLALYPAAFSARYGDRTASYLDVSTREGSRDRVHGRLSASGTSAATVFEGPLGRARRGSWIVSARKSYLEYLVGRITPENDVSIGFADIQAKLAYDASAESRVTADFLWGRTELHRNPQNRGVTSLIDARGQIGVANLGWSYTPNARLLWQARVYWMAETYRNDNRDRELLGRGRYDEGALKSDLSLDLGGRHRLEAGVLARFVKDRILDRRFNFTSRLFLEFDSVSTGYRHDAAYAQERWKVFPGRLAVTAGVRVERFGLTGQTVIDPRAGLEWRLSPGDRIDAGWGVYSQFPDTLPILGRNRNPISPLRAEVSRHAVVCYERLMSERARLRVELYEKRESNLLRAPGSLFRLLDGRVVFPDVDFIHDNALRGWTRGVELSLQRRSANRLSGWVSYAYERTRRHDLGTGERYAGEFDQRHTANLYGSYRLGADWNLSVKTRFGSGFPYPGYLEARGNDFYVAAERHTLRLPYYGRVDLRLNRAFNFDRRKLTLHFEVLNVFNRQNLRYDQTFGVNPTTGRASLGRDRLFPILPSAGLVFEF